MNWKELLSKFWAENKTATIGIVVAFFTLLYGTFFAGQQNPAPEVVEVAVVATVQAEGLKAPVTRVPTATKPVTTPTKTPTTTPTKPTPTFLPGGTASPTPSLGTATPGATPTQSTETCPPHENKWHAPQDAPCMHHIHGLNPRDPELVALFAKYGFDLNAWLNTNGELWQPAWISSPNEPIDHPDGFVWGLDSNPGCIQEGDVQIDFTKFQCLRYALIRFHDTGDSAHSLVRFHSLTGIFVVCGKVNGVMVDSAATCGVLTGGSSAFDGGELHNKYKQVHCPLPGEPPYTAANPLDLLSGGAYRVHSDDDRKIITWWAFQKPEAAELDLFPHNPNNLFGISYSATALQVLDTVVCGLTGKTIDELKDIERDALAASGQELHPDGAHNIFKITNIILRGGFPPAPSLTYVDQWGHIIQPGEGELCITPSPYCIPVQIFGNYPIAPDGKTYPAWMQRRVDAGVFDCPPADADAPCIILDTGGIKLKPYYLDQP